MPMPNSNTIFVARVSGGRRARYHTSTIADSTAVPSPITTNGSENIDGSIDVPARAIRREDEVARGRDRTRVTGRAARERHVRVVARRRRWNAVAAAAECAAGFDPARARDAMAPRSRAGAGSAIPAERRVDLGR